MAASEADYFADAPFGQEGTPGTTSLKMPEVAGDLKAEATTASRGLANLNLAAPKLRGATEEAVYKKASPSVVLILTDNALGSGSLISSDGTILTNHHVVENFKKVGVVFKPAIDGAPVQKSDVREADVVKIDEVADLALVKVRELPPNAVPLEFADTSVAMVGMDVHAIGHPVGETWTYTKGFISQIRKDYPWSDSEENLKHHADVIQTQTPINPGNSGGPLLTDEARIIGVNSFGADQMQGINFAVSADEVRRFLARADNRAAKLLGPPPCQPKTLFEGRSKKNTAYLMVTELECGQPGQVAYVVPDDQTRPICLYLDHNGTGRADAVIFDVNRDKKWDFSIYDLDGDGRPDIIGFHPDGDIRPSRFAKFDPSADYAPIVSKAMTNPF
jgi:S1-C subfamily serine protease